MSWVLLSSVATECLCLSCSNQVYFYSQIIINSYSKRAITNCQSSGLKATKKNQRNSGQRNKAASYKTVVKVALQSSACLIRSFLSSLRTEMHLQRCSKEHVEQNPSLLIAH